MIDMLHFCKKKVFLFTIFYFLTIFSGIIHAGTNSAAPTDNKPRKGISERQFFQMAYASLKNNFPPKSKDPELEGRYKQKALSLTRENYRKGISFEQSSSKLNRSVVLLKVFRLYEKPLAANGVRMVRTPRGYVYLKNGRKLKPAEKKRLFQKISRDNPQTIKTVKRVMGDYRTFQKSGSELQYKNKVPGEVGKAEILYHIAKKDAEKGGVVAKALDTSRKAVGVGFLHKYGKKTIVDTVKRVTKRPVAQKLATEGAKVTLKEGAKKGLSYYMLSGLATWDGVTDSIAYSYKQSMKKGVGNYVNEALEVPGKLYNLTDKEKDIIARDWDKQAEKKDSFLANAGWYIGGLAGTVAALAAAPATLGGIAFAAVAAPVAGCIGNWGVRNVYKTYRQRDKTLAWHEAPFAGAFALAKEAYQDVHDFWTGKPAKEAKNVQVKAAEQEENKELNAATKTIIDAGIDVELNREPAKNLETDKLTGVGKTIKSLYGLDVFTDSVKNLVNGLKKDGFYTTVIDKPMDAAARLWNGTSEERKLMIFGKDEDIDKPDGRVATLGKYAGGIMATGLAVAGFFAGGPIIAGAAVLATPLLKSFSSWALRKIYKHWNTPFDAYLLPFAPAIILAREAESDYNKAMQANKKEILEEESKKGKHIFTEGNDPDAISLAELGEISYVPTARYSKGNIDSGISSLIK
ncbi:hypothetical protein ACFL35_21785 [Candidatus Riflebacteria bacterium]